jgi:hypothetical protein
MSERVVTSLLIVAILWPSLVNAQVTIQEAESLPLHELSRRVLGETGSMVIDVDRPKGTLGSLRFYGRAVVTGSQFGMCGSDWITVDFEDGRVESIQTQRRYGVEGAIYRELGKWTYEESGRICDAVKTTRTYFPAPDAQAALEIALYVDAISGRGPFSNRNFTVHCDGGCSPGNTELAALQLGDIDQAREIDCADTSLKLPSCFELVVGEHQVGPFPKKYKIYGSYYMNDLVISEIKIYVASTLE